MTKWKCPCGHIFEREEMKTLVPGDIINIDGKLETTKAKRTGCEGCGFGVQLEKEPNRFQRMKKENERLHEIILHKCCNGNMGRVLELCNIKYS